MIYTKLEQNRILAGRDSFAKLTADEQAELDGTHELQRREIEQDQRAFEAKLEEERRLNSGYIPRATLEQKIEREIKRDSIDKFIFAGNAYFTVRNSRTGNRFTFRVSKPKNKRGDGEVHFVSVLTGPENTNNYSFLGTIFDKTNFRYSRKSAIGADAQSAKAWEWFFQKRNSLPDFIEVWHAGRCCRCGRMLTVPESIEAGIGPECAGR